MSDSTTDKTRHRRSPSLFATALRDLIDQTEIFSRAQWATALGVTTAAISQWLNDKTVPRARALRSLVDVVRKYRGDENQRLLAFLAVVDQPAHTVSPHGDRFGSSVGHYLVSPVLEGLLRQLDTLSYSAREAVLLNAVAECARLREVSEVAERTERRSSSFERKSIASTLSPATPALGGEPFIGRGTELIKVRDWLSAGSPVAVLGATGAGKTALAGEIVRRLFGSSPCQSIKRFEFKKSHDLPWGELREHVQRTCRAPQHGHRTGEPTIHGHESFLVVFDDVDMAADKQRELLAKFLREFSDAGPKLKVIVTYGVGKSNIVNSLWTAGRPSRPLETVYLSRLRDWEISQLLIALLENLAKKWNNESLRYATWLAAGSPGYCHHLVERARSCSATDLPITEYDVVEASTLLLNDTEGGQLASEALNRVSARAQSVALWSAMQDATIEAEEAGLPQFYRQANVGGKAAAGNLSQAIKEAHDAGLVERVNIGDRPAITLQDEAYRPHFRSMALSRFKQVPSALLTQAPSADAPA